MWVFPISGEPSALLAWQALLSDGERERAARFRLERDRNRFTVARARLREILASYLGQAPGDIGFEYGAHGKPRIAGPVDGLAFNLSHSGDWAALAVALEPVGMDLEAIRPEFEAEALAGRFFSREDRDWLRSRPEGERQRDFFRLWVAREARLKATGEGLTFPLERLLARWDGEAITALEEAGGIHRWSIRELALVDGFCAALAIAHPQPRIAMIRAE